MTLISLSTFFIMHTSEHKPTCTTEINSADDQNTIVNIVNTVNCCSYILICSLKKNYLYLIICVVAMTLISLATFVLITDVSEHTVELMVIKTNCK